MKLFLFSVRDSAANAFAAPFQAPTVAHATRSFTNAVNQRDDNSQLYMHPADFELWCVGIFDDEDGTFEVPTDIRRMVTRAKDVAVRD